MSVKKRKRNKYKPEFKAKMLKEHFDNKISIKELSIRYKTPLKTLWRWVTQTNKGIDITKNNKKGKVGRKKTELDWKTKYEILKKYQSFLKAQRKAK